MTQLTDQLLAYARGGKFQVEEISIGDFISSTQPLIQYNIKSTVGVKTDIPHDILGIKADLTQMQMVMSAIISNASEAIDSEGCIRITGRNIEIHSRRIPHTASKIRKLWSYVTIGHM